MSPTMTEGGIAGWKKQEGETFTAGDVLLEIVSPLVDRLLTGRLITLLTQETDKATIDVEAQDDGVMGKILVRQHALLIVVSRLTLLQLPDGSKNIKVGKVIALLAEEGDDISNLEPPKEKEEAPVSAKKEEAAPPSPEPSKPAQTASQPPPHSSTPPKHSRTLFPSVHRLLIEHNVSDAEKIKGTGIRGMLTKGDVLAYLGKASTPTGTFKEVAPPTGQAEKAAEKKPEYKVKALLSLVGHLADDIGTYQAPDGPALRRLIVSTMLQASIKARNAQGNSSLFLYPEDCWLTLFSSTPSSNRF